MEPNCHVIWELELCDCGSVNNKLFKNIVLGFLCEKDAHPFWFPVCCEVDLNCHPLFDCHIVTFLLDTMKLICALANERPRAGGCGLAENGTNHDAAHAS